MAGTNGNELARGALPEFLIDGARYAFPPVVGEPTIGVPSAHGAAPLDQHFAGGSNLPPVWPYSQGKQRGNTLLPLYPRLPEAALDDSKLHESLALEKAPARPCRVIYAFAIADRQAH